LFFLNEISYIIDVKNNNGFSLIELIVVVMIINILLGTAIVGYIGVQERARRAKITVTASTSAAELHIWLQSSFSSLRNLREIDTNFDGVINRDDMTNEELFNAGVVNTYINNRNTILKETSPWLGCPLWSSGDPPPNGTINVTQLSVNQIKIVAREKNGVIVYEQTISAD
jgi:prepilin-type N-terminal cleavage/methylation domain-containing protein